MFIFFASHLNLDLKSNMNRRLLLSKLEEVKLTEWAEFQRVRNACPTQRELRRKVCAYIFLSIVHIFI